MPRSPITRISRNADRPRYAFRIDEGGIATIPISSLDEFARRAHENVELKTQRKTYTGLQYAAAG